MREKFAIAVAARACPHDLTVSLADTGVHAGPVQVTGLVGGSEPAEYPARQRDPATLPEPLDRADLAEAAWTRYAKRDRSEPTIGL